MPQYSEAEKARIIHCFHRINIDYAYRIDKVRSELELRFRGNDQEMLWEISATVKHLVKKASPALLNFTKSTARSSKPSRKYTRVFVVYVDKATWLFQKCFRQCTRMIYLICFQCFLMWYISLEWYLLHCIVFCRMIIQYVAQIENLPSQHHGATPCQ